MHNTSKGCIEMSGGADWERGKLKSATILDRSWPNTHEQCKFPESRTSMGTGDCEWFMEGGGGFVPHGRRTGGLSHEVIIGSMGTQQNWGSVRTSGMSTFPVTILAPFPFFLMSTASHVLVTKLAILQCLRERTAVFSPSILFS